VPRLHAQREGQRFDVGGLEECCKGLPGSSRNPQERLRQLRRRERTSKWPRLQVAQVAHVVQAAPVSNLGLSRDFCRETRFLATYVIARRPLLSRIHVFGDISPPLGGECGAKRGRERICPCPAWRELWMLRLHGGVSIVLSNARGVGSGRPRMGVPRSLLSDLWPPTSVLWPLASSANKKTSRTIGRPSWGKRILRLVTMAWRCALRLDQDAESAAGRRQCRYLNCTGVHRSVKVPGAGFWGIVRSIAFRRSGFTEPPNLTGWGKGED
jgi:hypothetical protein